MVRPAASEENKRIGLMFARAVSRAAMALRAAGDGVHPDPAAAAADGGRRGAQVTTPVESEDCPLHCVVNLPPPPRPPPPLKGAHRKGG